TWKASTGSSAPTRHDSKRSFRASRSPRTSGRARRAERAPVTGPAAAPPAIGPDDVARWRADTPGATRRHHLNNAGAALQPQAVLDAVHHHLALESEIGGYEAAAAAQARLDDTCRAVAALIAARPRNIAVASSATAAYAAALSAFDFAPGDAIVTTRADYLSNRIMFEALAARRGVRIREAEDVPYLVDGCQAVGQLVVDFGALRCDFLAATARKFLRGPRGIGFLAVSDRALERQWHPLFVDMRGAAWVAPGTYRLYDGARRFEQWEQPLALVLGMGAAARYAMDAGVPRTSARAHALADAIRR